MRAWELYEFNNDDYDGGGWYNVKTKNYVSSNGAYHVLSVFHNMEKFGLTPEKMKSIPAFAKWFKLDWASITGNDDPEDLESWWMDLDPHGKIPTISGNAVNHNKDGNEHLLDGDMEIIKWMNDEGWVRTIRHKDFGEVETAIQGGSLKQIQRAALYFDKKFGIEMLYYDLNDLKTGGELRGEQLQHFLRHGNVNFPMGMTENIIDKSNNEKQWVKPADKKIIVVNKEYHHTQYAHMAPQKFGLSGNLFKGYDYPMNDEDKPELYDINVAKKMFASGWVRTNVEKGIEANIHCLDLKTAATTLRVLKQRFNDLSVAIIDLGPDIMALEHHILRNDEYGKGSLRTFLRTGKIVK